MSFFYNPFNCFIDSLNIGQYVSITKSHCLNAKLVQFSCPDFIPLFTIIPIVLSAISLDIQLILRGIEIQNISTNRKLSSEFYPS